MNRVVNISRKKNGDVMISIPKDEFQQILVKDLMISSEKVAHVQIGNGLEQHCFKTCS